MRIAIVDDIASERKCLNTELDVQVARLSLDSVTFEYASGADFLAAAKKERFDLVFLDMYMGNENGRSGNTINHDRTDSRPHTRAAAYSDSAPGGGCGPGQPL